ncbi:MAG: copper chaperone PCu(A)C, partial [Gammaproteobacteria bacterium]
MITERCPIVIILILTAMSVHANDSILISEAWIAEAPPAAGVNAGYARIENRGNDTLILESVSSPVFPRIEVHQNIIEDNIARMEHHPTVTIPPGESLLLQPGGFHLMLYNARTELTTGDSVNLVFTFSGGHSLKVEAEVRKLSVPHHHDLQQHEETTGSTMLDKIKVSYQHLLPQH